MGVLTGFRVERADGESPAALILSVGDAPLEQIEAANFVLRIAAAIPSCYQKGLVLSQNAKDTIRFAIALDLLVLMNESQRFMEAAFTLCNELAARYECTRVSLGWMIRGYVRLQAMSHVEKFEKRTTAVRSLETAMEEASDQDEEIPWSAAADSDSITRAHEDHARESSTAILFSLPVRLDGKVVAVLTCERGQPGFSPAEIDGLRLVCDQAAPRLADLQRRDRWLGARMATAFVESFSGLLGPEHTLAKLPPRAGRRRSQDAGSLRARQRDVPDRRLGIHHSLHRPQVPPGGSPDGTPLCPFLGDRADASRRHI